MRPKDECGISSYDMKLAILSLEANGATKYAQKVCYTIKDTNDLAIFKKNPFSDLFSKFYGDAEITIEPIQVRAS
ncbi:hypothetical protein ACFL3C_00010 [Patescibacteria group bacterium]